MTTTKELTSISKFLSLVLRHEPQSIDLVLDPAGWASTGDLLVKARSAGKHLDRELLEEVVASSDKKRFALSDDGQRIRANQGHSIDVELGLAPKVPPAMLYHGTAGRFLESILREGLDKRARHHVHLTRDRTIARSVGQRYGAPVLLAIDSKRMHSDGCVFFESDNGVWLTERVPTGYLSVIE